MMFTTAQTHHVHEGDARDDPIWRPARMSDRAVLRAFLRDRDIPCPRCGYNLRALPDANCPECGAPLTIHIGSPRMALGAWLGAVISICIPLGFSLTMSAVAAYSALRGETWIESDVTAMLVLGTSNGVLALFVWLLIRRRERWLVQPAAARRARATVWMAAACAATVALVAILGAALE